MNVATLSPAPSNTKKKETIFCCNLAKFLIEKGEIGDRIFSFLENCVAKNTIK